MGDPKETADSFSARMGGIIQSGFAILGISIGSRLGLFELMASFSEPKTSQEIADAAGFKERYVREWLGIMVTADIFELNVDGGYFLPSHRHAALVQKGTAVSTVSWALPIAARVEDDIMECFKKDGPGGVPYSRYPGFQEWRDRRALDQMDRLKATIGMIPGAEEKMRAGITVAELGCGTGQVLLYLAAVYPNSMFHGLEISEEAIAYGKKEANQRGLKNVLFQFQDVCEMPADWTDKWDLMIIIDTAHDLPYTTKAFKEIQRTLKPGSQFAMVDINLHSKQIENLGNPAAPFLYAFSLFHCMPVSLSFEGGEGLGNTWGKEKAVEMLKEAGFKNISMVREDKWDFLCVCHK